MELTIVRDSPGIDVPNEEASVGGHEENSVEGVADESGHGVLELGLMGESPSMMSLEREVGVMIEELETPSIKKNLELAVDVGSIVGLSCDGQEGMQLDCLKRIIVDKHGKGGDNICSDLQQEEDSFVREWGNCSDYEA